MICRPNSPPYVVFAMAGQSIRFSEAGYKLPKYLLGLDSLPMFFLAAAPFEAEGFEAHFVCDEESLADSSLGLENSVRKYLPNATLHSTPKNRLGPTFSVLGADLSGLDQSRPVVLSYIDCFSSFSPGVLLQYLQESEADVAAVAFRGAHHPANQFGNTFAYLRVLGPGVKAVSEKIPFTGCPQEEFASTGVYAFRNLETMLDGMERQIADEETHNGEFYSSLALNSLIKMGKKVVFFETDSFIDVGTPNAYEEFRSNAAIFFSKNYVNEEVERSSVAASEAVIVLAAGKGSRFERQRFPSAKPNLTFGHATILENLYRTTILPLSRGLETIFAVSPRVIRDWSPGELAEWNSRGEALLIPPNGSSLETLKYTLSNMRELGSFHALACDLIVDGDELRRKLRAEFASEGFVLWVGPPTFFSRNRPDMFSWVQIDDNGNVVAMTVKESPEFFDDAYLVLGSFSFRGSSEEFLKELEEVLTNSPGTRELHMEELVALRLRRGKKVTAMVVRNFVSLGTPDEYGNVVYHRKFLERLNLGDSNAVENLPPNESRLR